MSKNIVVCCDGTWNRFDKDKITNVVRLSSCLVRHTADQVVYYDPGVGTIAAERWITRLGRAYSKLMGGAFGAGIDRNVTEAYSFIADHWKDDDRIFLFGFSRGAYAVRALAAAIHYFGLLQRHNDNLHPYIREMFLARENGKPDFELYRRFKATFARAVSVHFVGCWDTVASVGWVAKPVMLPSTAKNPSIAHIRHAVSIDEQRKWFRPNLFTKARLDQDLKEVWFAGVHADVGGGYAEEESGLAKISLAWMLREAEACGILLKQDRVKRILGGDSKYAAPDPKALAHNPFDKLSWGILQFVPRRSFRMRGNQLQGFWDSSWQRRPRTLPSGAILHSSVIERDTEKKFVAHPFEH